jgi:hypothetical protein
MEEFSEMQIQEIWDKGIRVEDVDSKQICKDVGGAWIKRNLYGKEDIFGWEIDHVYPLSKGGDAQLVNLRPMHWENNRSKANDYPTYNTVKTSEGDTNIDKANSFSVNESLQGELKKIYNIR